MSFIDSLNPESLYEITVEGFTKVKVGASPEGTFIAFRAWKTTHPSDKDWELEGWLKWDGCVDYNLKGSYHFCERKDMDNLASLFDKIGDQAVIHIPHYEGDFYTEKAGEE
jgi:hypothetical protein